MGLTKFASTPYVNQMIILKLIDENDADKFYQLINSNYERLKDYFPESSKGVTSKEAAIDRINEYLIKAGQKKMFAFAIRVECEIIGMLFIKDVNLYHNKCEIAYFIDQKHEGKGIATLALFEAKGYIFRDLMLQKIYCRVAPSNLSSNRVAVKSGFKLEGILRNEFKLDNGSYTDINYYGLTLNDLAGC